MAQTQTIVSQDGLSLFVRKSLVKNAKRTVVLIHGFAEHSGRYGHILEALNHAKMNAVAFDLRGHGRSEGGRGHIDSLRQYTDDVHAAVEFAKKESRTKQVVLMAHSMGALVAVHYATIHENNLLGLILSSPLFGIKVKVPTWKAALGDLMSKYCPTFTMPNNINADDLTHDKKMAAVYGSDPLIFHHVRARWFCEIQKSLSEAHLMASRLSLPLLLQLSDQDRIVDFNQSCHWYERCRMPDRTQLIYEGFFHEIYNEIERARPISDAMLWLTDRCAVNSRKLNAILTTDPEAYHHDAVRHVAVQ